PLDVRDPQPRTRPELVPALDQLAHQRHLTARSRLRSASIASEAALHASTVLGGWFEGLAPGVLLAAGDPSRVPAMAWWNPAPRTVWARDYPWGDGPDDVTRALEALQNWG